MKNVDAAPALLRCRYGGGECRFLGDVGFEVDAFAAPCLTIDTVASADARSRSTAMTFAPSCANRSAVARLLPHAFTRANRRQ